ncbi:hypothetical protein [Amycolatopsis nigrescens]|uniref:hypothetical protein n=1 Tax=Amycolatopsis nigrescens TaxID=381445 RepID=UPI0012FAD6DD|nr:hypothetical protein [Amycolatopsis nigrescens]
MTDVERGTSSDAPALRLTPKTMWTNAAVMAVPPAAAALGLWWPATVVSDFGG